MELVIQAMKLLRAKLVDGLALTGSIQPPKPETRGSDGVTGAEGLGVS